MSNITNPQAFQAFHSVIGELIFIPWIIAFVVLILAARKQDLGPARLLPSAESSSRRPVHA